jgi:hypothetical protein
MKIINRLDAFNQKLTHYFTGNPCCRNHVSPRFVSTGGCVDCLRLRQGVFTRSNNALIRKTIAVEYLTEADRVAIEQLASYLLAASTPAAPAPNELLASVHSDKVLAVMGVKKKRP